VTSNDLERETTEVLQRLVRFNTVNPPGNERPAIEYLADYVRAAGFRTEVLADDAQRPNLVADLSGAADGPTLCFLGHVDTVLADPADWQRGPWSGRVEDGYLWGRGSIDMKSQVAAEAVAAVTLARGGWRPARGRLMLVFVSDEETGGDVGARWLTEQHPEKVRCDMLLNEGAGQSFDLGGRRRYGVCCAEKGIFRFLVTARGASGHASVPRTGDNALLKLAPILQRIGQAPPSYELASAPAAMLEALGEDPAHPGDALARIGAGDPALLTLIEPMFGVTLTPTMVHASDKINVIPASAWLKIDCRVPPGLGAEAARRRLDEVLGEHGRDLNIEFTEQVTGNESPVTGPMVDAIDRWVRANDPGAETIPVILPGFSDSRWFRDAFPECAAYGFFPQRDQGLLEAFPLIHNADERISVGDLGFAARFYADIARELLG
jgi:acetylornithine deacetylase/succinyl-diaminopimelate desuccinylase-like protein